MDNYPWVWTRRSVSKPNESIVGTFALTVYKGVPGFAVSDIIWPLLLCNTLYIAFKQSAVH